LVPGTDSDQNGTESLSVPGSNDDSNDDSNYYSVWA